MPLATKGLDILANHGFLTLTTLRGSSFCPFGLARHAPRVPVLLNMGHTTFKRIATLGAKEVTEVPVGTKGNHVLAHDRCFAVFAAWCEEFVPVKMTIEAKTGVPILSHRLARLLGQDLTRCTSSNPVETCLSVCVGLG